MQRQHQVSTVITYNPFVRIELIDVQLNKKSYEVYRKCRLIIFRMKDIHKKYN